PEGGRRCAERPENGRQPPPSQRSKTTTIQERRPPDRRHPITQKESLLIAISRIDEVITAAGCVFQSPPGFDFDRTGRITDQAPGPQSRGGNGNRDSVVRRAVVGH